VRNAQNPEPGTVTSGFAHRHTVMASPPIDRGGPA
jgi:hypothetical protein